MALDSGTAENWGVRSRNERSATIIGGGPAGLACATAVERAGVRATVLESAEEVGSSWRRHYDRLQLNTSRFTATLPGLRYPGSVGLFPSRDEFVDYLERYVERHRIDVRPAVRALRVERNGDAWTIETSRGELATREVIVATGYANETWIPAWRGQDRFGGQILHSARYRNPSSFIERDVLVAGAGSSAMEIAHDLAEGGAQRVRMAIRTPPNIVLRSVAGVPGDLPAVPMLRLPERIADAQLRMMRRIVLGDLSEVGLPIPEEGVVARLHRLGVSPAVVDREVIDSVKRGAIEIVSAVDGFDGSSVLLADRTRISPDAVIAATGYRCGLERLVGHLGVLDDRGVPTTVGGDEAAAGLRFVGYVPVPGQIRQIAREAKRAAAGIARRRR